MYNYTPSVLIIQLLSRSLQPEPMYSCRVVQTMYCKTATYVGIVFGLGLSLVNPIGKIQKHSLGKALQLCYLLPEPFVALILILVVRLLQSEGAVHLLHAQHKLRLLAAIVCLSI